MLAVSGDVADPDAIERLFAQTEERFGDCDLLVNNAGMIDPKPLLETTLEDWERMFAVNVRGTYLASRRALRSMIARREGAIVNVASISGVPGPEKYPGWASYCASKAAVISFTEALAVETRLLEADGQYGLSGVSEAIGSAAAEWGADLLVVGTKGRRGLERLVIGSVAGKLVNTVGMSIFLVRLH